MISDTVLIVLIIAVAVVVVLIIYRDKIGKFLLKFKAGKVEGETGFETIKSEGSQTPQQSQASEQPSQKVIALGERSVAIGGDASGVHIQSGDSDREREKPEAVKRKSKKAPKAKESVSHSAEAEGKRSVAIGGDADNATIITGDQGKKKKK